MLRRFYETWYTPNNAILVIARDVQPDAALADAKAAFGNVPSRAVPEHAAFTLQPVQPKTLWLETDFPVGLVTIAYRMPGLKDDDFAAADILSDVLASERAALYGLVPAGKALMARFSYRAKADVGVGMVYTAFPSADDPAPVLADVRRIIADAARDGVLAGTRRGGETAGTGRKLPLPPIVSRDWRETGRMRWPFRAPSRPRISPAPTPPSLWTMSIAWRACCWIPSTP